MEKKQLRTVKKSNDTGRLDRDAVRSAVIAVRDARMARVPVPSSRRARRAAKETRVAERVSYAGY